MTEKFLKKVLRERSVCTKKYHYWCQEDTDKNQLLICRIENYYAGTTAVINPASDLNPNGYEVVKIIK